MYKDKEIECKCGTRFLFTAKDQEFYAEKGFKPPKRCKICRLEKKKRYENQTAKS